MEVYKNTKIRTNIYIFINLLNVTLFLQLLIDISSLFIWSISNVNQLVFIFQWVLRKYFGVEPSICISECSFLFIPVFGLENKLFVTLFCLCPTNILFWYFLDTFRCAFIFDNATNFECSFCRYASDEL